MQTHLRVVAWLNIIWGGINIVVGALIWLLFMGIGAAAATGAGSLHEALPILGLFGGIGAFIFLLIAIWGFPSVIAGYGMLRQARWARVAGIVTSICHLFCPPMGTALGVYGLVVLFDPQTTALLEGPRRTY